MADFVLIDNDGLLRAVSIINRNRNNDDREGHISTARKGCRDNRVADSKRFDDAVRNLADGRNARSPDDVLLVLRNLLVHEGYLGQLFEIIEITGLEINDLAVLLSLDLVIVVREVTEDMEDNGAFSSSEIVGNRRGDHIRTRLLEGNLRVRDLGIRVIGGGKCHILNARVFNFNIGLKLVGNLVFRTHVDVDFRILDGQNRRIYRIDPDDQDRSVAVRQFRRQVCVARSNRLDTCGCRKAVFRDFSVILAVRAAIDLRDALVRAGPLDILRSVLRLMLFILYVNREEGFFADIQGFFLKRAFDRRIAPASIDHNDQKECRLRAVSLDLDLAYARLIRGELVLNDTALALDNAGADGRFIVCLSVIRDINLSRVNLVGDHADHNVIGQLNLRNRNDLDKGRGRFAVRKGCGNCRVTNHLGKAFRCILARCDRKHRSIDCTESEAAFLDRSDGPFDVFNIIGLAVAVRSDRSLEDISGANGHLNIAARRIRDRDGCAILAHVADAEHDIDRRKLFRLLARIPGLDNRVARSLEADGVLIRHLGFRAVVFNKFIFRISAVRELRNRRKVDARFGRFVRDLDLDLDKGFLNKDSLRRCLDLKNQNRGVAVRQCRRQIDISGAEGLDTSCSREVVPVARSFRLAGLDLFTVSVFILSFGFRFVIILGLVHNTVNLRDALIRARPGDILSRVIRGKGTIIHSRREEDLGAFPNSILIKLAFDNRIAFTDIFDVDQKVSVFHTLSRQLNQRDAGFHRGERIAFDGSGTFNDLCLEGHAVVGLHISRNVDCSRRLRIREHTYNRRISNLKRGLRKYLQSHDHRIAVRQGSHKLHITFADAFDTGIALDGIGRVRRAVHLGDGFIGAPPGDFLCRELIAIFSVSDLNQERGLLTNFDFALSKRSADGRRAGTKVIDDDRQVHRLCAFGADLNLGCTGLVRGERIVLNLTNTLDKLRRDLIAVVGRRVSRYEDLNLLDIICKIPDNDLIVKIDRRLRNDPDRHDGEIAVRQSSRKLRIAFADTFDAGIGLQRICCVRRVVNLGNRFVGAPPGKILRGVLIAKLIVHDLNQEGGFCANFDLTAHQRTGDVGHTVAEVKDNHREIGRLDFIRGKKNPCITRSRAGVGFSVNAANALNECSFDRLTVIGRRVGRDINLSLFRVISDCPVHDRLAELDRGDRNDLDKGRGGFAVRKGCGDCRVTYHLGKAFRRILARCDGEHRSIDCTESEAAFLDRLDGPFDVFDIIGLAVAVRSNRSREDMGAAHDHFNIAARRIRDRDGCAILADIADVEDNVLRGYADILPVVSLDNRRTLSLEGDDLIVLDHRGLGAVVLNQFIICVLSVIELGDRRQIDVRRGDVVIDLNIEINELLAIDNDFRRSLLSLDLKNGDGKVSVRQLCLQKDNTFFIGSNTSVNRESKGFSRADRGNIRACEDPGDALIRARPGDVSRTEGCPVGSVDHRCAERGIFAGNDDLRLKNRRDDRIALTDVFDDNRKISILNLNAIRRVSADSQLVDAGTRELNRLRRIRNYILGITLDKLGLIVQCHDIAAIDDSRIGRNIDKGFRLVVLDVKGNDLFSELDIRIFHDLQHDDCRIAIRERRDQVDVSGLETGYDRGTCGVIEDRCHDLHTFAVGN